MRINWNPKAENLAELASELNIGADAMLFVDDNPAEIQNVEISGLGVRTLLARNPADTLRRLRYYPGLLKLRKSSEDEVRAADIRANRERKALVETLAPGLFRPAADRWHSRWTKKPASPGSPIFRQDQPVHLGYRRYTETEVRRLMQAPDGCVVTACMSDLLSDSGMIAFAAARAVRGRLCEELVVAAAPWKKSRGRHASR